MPRSQTVETVEIETTIDLDGDEVDVKAVVEIAAPTAPTIRFNVLSVVLSDTGTDITGPVTEQHRYHFAKLALDQLLDEDLEE